MFFLLSEDYESNELLSTYIRKALTSTLFPQVAHEVEDRLTTQHFVGHVSTHHYGGLVLQDGAAVAWPEEEAEDEVESTKY